MEAQEKSKDTTSIHFKQTFKQKAKEIQLMQMFQRSAYKRESDSEHDSDEESNREALAIENTTAELAKRLQDDEAGRKFEENKAFSEKLHYEHIDQLMESVYRFKGKLKKKTLIPSRDSIDDLSGPDPIDQYEENSTTVDTSRKSN